MKKYLMEAFGTFFLALIISLSVNPIAIGLGLAALVYLGGYISGAHYNPAVSFAVYIRGKISRNHLFGYWISQIIGATGGMLVYYFLYGLAFTARPAASATVIQALTVEILFTAFLASVVLHVATSAKTKNNSYFGLAIGAALLAGIFAGSSISGAVYNPAIAIGSAIVGMHFDDYATLLAIYIIGPLAGGLLAGFFYKMIESE